MEFFYDLGMLVEQRWRDKDYGEEFFPAIAAQALAEMPPANLVDPWDIVRWVHKETDLTKQMDLNAKFGNPPITLYHGARFYIDIYFWLEGTTSIHQHGFSGAFQVLLGSSILSTYRFENRKDINAHFASGQLVLNHVELLEKGNIRKIVAGRSYIHSLFHLDNPSATIVIRTHQTPEGLPQYDYQKPYLAVDPYYSNELTTKKLQTVALLLNVKHPDADSMIADLIKSADFQTTYRVLEIAFVHLGRNAMEAFFQLSMSKDRFEALVDIARRRHGEIVDLIRPVLEENERQNNIILRRRQITAAEHRFFLALLLNVSDREKVLALVKQRFPDNDPVDTVADWVEELSTTRVWGSSEPNALGIKDFDADYLFALQCMLRGLNNKQTKAEFEREYSNAYVKKLGDGLQAMLDSIRSSTLFKSILSDPQPVLPRARNRSLKLVTKRASMSSTQRSDRARIKQKKAL